MEPRAKASMHKEIFRNHASTVNKVLYIHKFNCQTYLKTKYFVVIKTNNKCLITILRTPGIRIDLKM